MVKCQHTYLIRLFNDFHQVAANYCRIYYMARKTFKLNRFYKYFIVFIKKTKLGHGTESAGRE